MEEFAAHAFARKTALEFLLGMRPAGGPYYLTIDDDARWKGSDYAMTVSLWSGDDSETLIYRGPVRFEDLLVSLSDLR